MGHPDVSYPDIFKCVICSEDAYLCFEQILERIDNLPNKESLK